MGTATDGKLVARYVAAYQAALERTREGREQVAAAVVGSAYARGTP